MAAVATQVTKTVSSSGFHHRVLCEVIGSGPNGETTPASRFFTLQEHPAALTLSPRSESDAAAAAARSLRFLLVDPMPGSLLVFPSFLPHFVAPSDPTSAGEGADAPNIQPHGGPLRVSIAANL